MPINEAYLARVEAYFDGSMPAEERAGFLDEVKANPELEMAFDFQASLIIAVEQRQLREERATPLKRWLTPQNRPYLLAAAVALLLLMAGTWYLIRPQPRAQQLAVAESLAAPDLFLPSQAKGPGQAGQAELDSLTLWRQQQAHPRIIQAYEGLDLPSDAAWSSLTTQQALALGIAYLHAAPPEQDLAQAERYLQAVLRHSSDRSLRNYVRRQQVLLSLKRGQPEQARARLDTLARGLVDPQQAVQRQAQQALEAFDP